MSTSISFDWFHWFDLFVIGVLGLGMFLGRRSTALDQILGFVQWVLVAVICAFLYKAPAGWIADAAQMRPDVVALIIYPLLVVVVCFGLGLVRKSIFGKTDKMELFGKREHQISMFVGMFRVFAILFLVMAWLHGRYVTEEILRDYRAYCKENFGNITWPALCTMQEGVFDESYVGKAARSYVRPLLIAPLPPSEALLAAEEKEKAEKERKMVSKKPSGPESADAIIDELETHGKTKEKRPRDGTAGANGKPDPYSVIYHQLTLKGISGAGAGRLALINNQALKAGESELVKVEGNKMKILCKEIRESSVLIQVEDKPEIIELRLNDPSTNATKVVNGKS